MAWLGVEAGEHDACDEAIMELGLKITRKFDNPIEVKTSRGWLKFRVYEVLGEVEGVAQIIAQRTGRPALEAGRHLVLGETSARLWDEAVKVFFPDGHSEVIPVFTYDGFLDVKMPNKNIRGVEATIVVGGTTYRLPLSIRDLSAIFLMGEEYLEKIEKAASAYGIDKIISKEALEALRKAQRAARVEVDYDSMLVFIFEESRMRSISLQRYFLELVYSERYSEAEDIFKKAPSEARDALEKTLRDEAEILKLTKDQEKIRRLREFSERISLKVGL